MTFVNFLVLGKKQLSRVTRREFKEADLQAMQRALTPLLSGDRSEIHDGFFAAGKITSKQSILDIFDDTTPIACLGYCSHSRKAKATWELLHQNASPPLQAPQVTPHAPWAVLRIDVMTPPPWLLDWAAGVPFAIDDLNAKP